jgi:ferrochelatase
LKEKLIKKLDPEKYLVAMAMRYQNPSIKKGLK